MVSGCWNTFSGNTADDCDAPRVVLPEREQVSRGRELLQMLREQTSVSCGSARKDRDDTPQTEDVEVKVVVKHTFIEVVDPRMRRLNRSMSDSDLLYSRYDREHVWQKVACDKFQDLSDASTTISNDMEDGKDMYGEVEDYANWSPSGYNSIRKDTCWSDDEGAVDMSMQPCMPYGYVESWWMMPVSFDPNASVLCSGMANGERFNEQSYMQSQWGESCDNSDADGSSQEWRTTVMLRNMPNNYTRDMLLELVNSMGFAGCFDFAYLPVDFKSQAGLGYAFINFISTAEAQRCFDCFEGFSEWKVPSEKVCTVTWGSPYQGLEAHIERYQNSPVMHQSIPDEWKPVLFDNGVRVVFPAPTKAIKTPKVRQQPAAVGA